jgi:uncharacterized cupredoxin-like copper-binding protein
MYIRVLILVALLAIAGLVAAACGGDDAGSDTGGTDMGGSGTTADGSSVTVHLTNWAVEPSAKTLTAGKIKFTTMHDMDHTAMSGKEGATHQLVVARLPDGAKAGQSKFGSPVVNLTDIKPGETKTAEAELSPGTYELACLVVEQVNGKNVNHYEKGMYTQLTVT